MKLKDACSLEEKPWPTCLLYRQYTKKQRHYFTDKSLYSQSFGFSTSHVQMWGLDHKEGWAQNCCLLTEVLEKTLESPLGSKEIKTVNSKDNQPWILIGRIEAETEIPILWPFDVKNWFIGKGPDAGKNWRQKDKGLAENEMVRWHHQLNGHEFEQSQGDIEGQASLACCSPWGWQRVGSS